METAPALPLQQHPDFGAALARLGARVDYLELSGAAPVLRIRRFGVNFVSRGPIWADADPDAKIAALRAAPIRLLNDDATGADMLRRAGFRQIMTPAHVAEIDLTGSPADRIAAAKKKWRNIWRKAQDAPVRIEITRFDPARHDWLLRADLAQQRVKRYRALPHALLAAWDPDALILFTAHSGKAPTAAMLFVAHAPTVTYHIGWSDAEGRRLAIHHRILMQAANHFAVLGFTRLDLGTVDTENASGLARFKIGCDARIRPLGGTWLKIPGL